MTGASPTLDLEWRHSRNPNLVSYGTSLLHAVKEYKTNVIRHQEKGVLLTTSPFSEEMLEKLMLSIYQVIALLTRKFVR